MNAHGDPEMNDFEFERKFWVRNFPKIVLSEPAATLIVQSYFVSKNGNALRVRVTADLELGELSFHLDGNNYSEEKILNVFCERFNFASVGVKGPPIGGTRYEKEMIVEVSEAVPLVLANGALVAKQRYGIFYSGDGWNVDVFAGRNWPLIIAECERSTPVTQLDIPSFCTVEVTDVMAFTNDSLSTAPFSLWSESFRDGYNQVDHLYSEDF